MTLLFHALLVHGLEIKTFFFCKFSEIFPSDWYIHWTGLLHHTGCAGCTVFSASCNSLKTPPLLPELCRPKLQNNCTNLQTVLNLHLNVWLQSFRSYQVPLPRSWQRGPCEEGVCPSWTQPVLAGSSCPRAGPGSANQSSRRCHSDQVSQWGTNVTQQQGMRDTAWAPAQHTHAPRLQTDLMTSGESATGINLCAGMCEHRKDLPSPFPFILLLMKSLTVTLICDSIKSFLMLKILHFLEHQPTAKGLVCSHCYPFTVFPSPIKSKCVPRSSLLPICFQSEELITLYKLHLQNCGDNFFSVWFWGFIWSMRIYSLW